MVAGRAGWLAGTPGRVDGAGAGAGGGSAAVGAAGRAARGGALPGTGPAVPSSTGAQAWCSAALNATQLAKRSAGDLASPRVSTRSTAGGRPGRRLVSAGGAAFSWAHITAMFSSRRNGGAPASSSNAVQASA